MPCGKNHHKFPIKSCKTSHAIDSTSNICGKIPALNYARLFMLIKLVSFEICLTKPACNGNAGDFQRKFSKNKLMLKCSAWVSLSKVVYFITKQLNRLQISQLLSDIKLLLSSECTQPEIYFGKACGCRFPRSLWGILFNWKIPKVHCGSMVNSTP